MKAAHAIGQAELAPVLVAYFVLEGAKALVCIDNDGARFGLIGNRSRSVASLTIVGTASLEVCCLGMRPWYERVPGLCNISDGPSTLDFEEVVSLGSKGVELEVT